MKLSEVIGQTAAQSLLRSMADSDRIPHALLLLGMPGSGDLALAFAFAQYVLCDNRANGDSCGICSNCLKASKLVHPDLHSTFPTVGTNVTSDALLPDWRKAILENPWMDVNQWLQRIGAENKQGNINKEECVAIVRKLSLKPFEGRYKILVLWLPEYLQKEGNRLLKLIEEPPDDTLLLLVAQNSELILNTILSRCQLVKVKRLSDEDVEQALMQRKGLSLEKARSLSLMAEGDFNEALQLAAQPDNNYSALFLDWLRKCYQGNGIEMVNWVEKFADLGRENQKQFLQYALHFLREFAVLSVGTPFPKGEAFGLEKTAANPDSYREVRLLPNELTTAQNLAKVLGLGQIERIVKLFDGCAYHIERNANQKLLFLDASIHLNRIFVNRDEG